MGLHEGAAFGITTRRTAIAVGLGAVATASLARPAVGQPLPAAAGDGPTTLGRTLDVGVRDRHGWRTHVLRDGDVHVVRRDLGDASPSRAARRRPIAAFAHFTDIHVLDAQSPSRFEFIDRYRDETGLPEFGGAYRPHDLLTTQVAESTVLAVRAMQAAPATGLPLAFAISTGDATDSCQHNELRWVIDLLDGGPVTPDSGLAGVFEGVSDASPDGYDPYYWHPAAPPDGHPIDDFKRRHGFPTVPELTAAAIRPFEATGLGMPWYAAHGNHDGVVRGGFAPSEELDAIARGTAKPIGLPTGLTPPEFVDRLMLGDNRVLTDLRSRTITADAGRRLVSRREVVAEHFRTTGSPVGHGFSATNRRDGTAYYVADAPTSAGGSSRPLRLVVLDSVNEHGDGNGSLDAEQFAWLRDVLAAAPDRATAVFSHHTTRSMDNELRGDDGARVLGPEVVRLLLSHPQVVLWVNGHVHRNEVTPHRAPGRPGGFWEVTTASHIDWPQQVRTIELADNGDGTLSIFGTMVDSAAPAHWDGSVDSPLALASLSRELAANDPQRWDRPNASVRRYRGEGEDRNVELLVAVPKGVVL